MASDTVRSLDRISMLPDSILCHILSFLPTKCAVGTSILSTRYQYLWTCITSLHFDKAEFFTNDIGEAEAEADLSFTNFVSTVLLLINVFCLGKFSLKRKSFHNIYIVKSWISTAIKRSVQKLELQYFDFNRTLVDLTLDGMISALCYYLVGVIFVTLPRVYVYIQNVKNMSFWVWITFAYYCMHRRSHR